jgi:hypothetical protein
LDQLLNEVLSFVEGDIRWWDEAAQHVEELTSGLPEAERRKWQVLVAVYRERAQAHTELYSRERSEMVWRLTQTGISERT